MPDVAAQPPGGEYPRDKYIIPLSLSQLIRSPTSLFTISKYINTRTRTMDEDLIAFGIVMVAFLSMPFILVMG